MFVGRPESPKRVLRHVVCCACICFRAAVDASHDFMDVLTDMTLYHALLTPRGRRQAAGLRS